jgi:hypothetical protein
MTGDIGSSRDLMGIERGEAPLRNTHSTLTSARGEGRVRGAES